MRRNIKYILIGCLFISLSSFHKDITMNPIEEVKQAMNGQVEAWNRGDLEKAMSYYWNSPEMLWINRGGTSKGYQPVLDSYQKDFTDKTKMGTYSYEALHIEELPGSSVYFVIRWKIMLNDKKAMGGVSSLVWKKINGDWVITIEHAS